MRTHFVPALVMLLLLTLVTGVLYPLLVTLVAQGLFRGKAEGSLLHKDDRVVGSELIGQTFTDPKWFWGRPSATSPSTNAAASSGSNLGPTNPALAQAVDARVEALRRADPDNHEAIPVDLVTASGSGLDPHISPTAAEFQAGRVARARGLDPARVQALVERHIEGRTFGVLGELRVNVLRLNLDLEELR